MTFTRVRGPHMLSLALLAGAALVPAGCGGGDGVSTYNTPKTTESGKKDVGEPAAAPAPAAGGDYRILGAMFPADNPEWFFKLTGPADALTPFEAGFDQLLASVSLGAGGPDFAPPEGWKRGPGRGQYVFATLRTPDGKYEVTVTSSAGGVVPNLKRWSVDQLGNASFGPDDLKKVTKPVEAKGVKGLRVDVRGPNNPVGGPMMGKR